MGSTLNNIFNKSKEHFINLNKLFPFVKSCKLLHDFLCNGNIHWMLKVLHGTINVTLSLRV